MIPSGPTLVCGTQEAMWTRRRYLVSYRGASDWRSTFPPQAGDGPTTKGGAEEIAVDEVPVGERPPPLRAYEREFGGLDLCRGPNVPGFHAVRERSFPQANPRVPRGQEVTRGLRSARHWGKGGRPV
jgi:hypothetical protein